GAGELLTLSPKDIIKEVEIFGQHEIAELTKSAEKLTLLLGRFVEHNQTLDGRKSQLRLELEKSRSRILDTQRGILAIDERLAALPSLEDTDLTGDRQPGVERQARAEVSYEAVLRELQKSKIDGEEFIRLRRQIEELRPLREKREHLARDLAAFEAHRHKLLSEWEDT